MVEQSCLYTYDRADGSVRIPTTGPYGDLTMGSTSLRGGTIVDMTFRFDPETTAPDAPHTVNGSHHLFPRGNSQ